MSHDPTAQTLLSLELCCRSLAQRILLIRELRSLQHGVPAAGSFLSPAGQREIGRHLRELPELEQRFWEACDEHSRLRRSGASLLLPDGSVGRETRPSLRDLVTAGLEGPTGAVSRPPADAET